MIQKLFEIIGYLLTNLLVLWDAHDPKGVHCLCKEILVLLPGDCDIPVGKETVVVVIFKEEVS